MPWENQTCWSIDWLSLPDSRWYVAEKVTSQKQAMKNLARWRDVLLMLIKGVGKIVLVPPKYAVSGKINISNIHNKNGWKYQSYLLVHSLCLLIFFSPKFPPLLSVWAQLTQVWAPFILRCLNSHKLSFSYDN